MRLVSYLFLTLCFAVLVDAANYPRVKKPCVADQDCFEDFEVCAREAEAERGVCVHKDIFPMNALEIAGCFMTFIVGLGGAGALIPILLGFFGFDTKQAIAQSNASILVASLARFLFNFNKSHPHKEGKGILVDYNVASLMLPTITVGATFGVMLNKVLPGLVQAILLSVLLVLVASTTLIKLFSIIRDEREKYGPVCGRKSESTDSPVGYELAQVMSTTLKTNVVVPLQASEGQGNQSSEE